MIYSTLFDSWTLTVYIILRRFSDLWYTYSVIFALCVSVMTNGTSASVFGSTTNQGLLDLRMYPRTASLKSTWMRYIFSFFRLSEIKTWINEMVLKDWYARNLQHEKTMIYYCTDSWSQWLHFCWWIFFGFLLIYVGLNILQPRRQYMLTAL